TLVSSPERVKPRLGTGTVGSVAAGASVRLSLCPFSGYHPHDHVGAAGHAPGLRQALPAQCELEAPIRADQHPRLTRIEVGVAVDPRRGLVRRDSGRLGAAREI